MTNLKTEKMLKDKWLFEYHGYEDNIVNPEKVKSHLEYISFKSIERVSDQVFTIQLQGSYCKEKYECSGYMVMTNNRVEIIFDKKFSGENM